MAQPVVVDKAQLPRKKAQYESRREMEFYRYYEPIRALTESGPSVCNLRDAESVKDHQPFSSPDRALTAFCQLGALRLGTRRAMLFFFDSKYAYVLAEATRTLSLQDDSVHDIEDNLWLGHSVIPRGYSICEETVCRQPDPDRWYTGPTSHEGIHVINDLEKDTAFCDRPFVTGGPKAKFYAGVPITTSRGITIGAYCCLDDRKREGLHEKDVAFLKDMAQTIMTHLEMVRAKAERERGTQMITSLGAFIEGAASLRGWEQERHRRDCMKISRPTFEQAPRPTASPIPSKTSGSTSMRQSHQTVTPLGSADTIPTINDKPGDVTPIVSASNSLSHSAKTSRHIEDVREQLVASNVRSAFQRASDLVREAIDVDGCVFLDGTIGSYGGLVEAQSDSEHGSDSLVSAPEASETEREGHKMVKERGSKDKICKVLASSHSSQDQYHTTSELQRVAMKTTITEKFLRSLLKRYPRGKIWNFNEQGDAPSDDDSSERSTSPDHGEPPHTLNTPKDLQSETSNETSARMVRRRQRRADDAREILRLFPGVRCLALVGIWDQNRGKWYAASAVWTFSPLRIFSQESEVAYVSAFNDVVIAEVHRIEAQNSDRAKSDFIGSISHELRSPLHGILGSVECLQEQPTDTFSAGLTSQIEVCGRTLLDIVDHLLDFSKINHNARRKLSMNDGSPRKRQTSTTGPTSQLGGMLSQDVDVALDEITEEVVETAVYSFCCSRDKQAILDRKVAVIMDIDRVMSVDINWKCRVPLGGWKRICINLVSNALKYTSEGYVRVSLKAEAMPGKRKRFNAIFTVTDSGRAMSKEFLENHLFEPFAQEDSLVEGNGLGMSLVAKIIGAMGGKIEVQSERGVGTTMTVTLPMEYSRLPMQNLAKDDLETGQRRPLEGKSLGILGFDNLESTPATGVHQHARVMLSNNIQRCCEHLGVHVKRTDWPLASNDVYLVAEGDLQAYHEYLRSRGSSAAAAQIPLIVLCDSVISARLLRAGSSAVGLTTTDVEFIAQPCGTERLAKAIGACMDRAAGTQLRGCPSTAEAVSEVASVAKHVNKQPHPDARLGNGSIQANEGSDRETNGNGRPCLTAKQRSQPTKLPTDVESSTTFSPHNGLEAKEDYLTVIRSKSTTGQPHTPSHIDNNVASPKEASLQRNDFSVGSSGLSLLLVDDNHINLRLLVNYAKKQGHANITATDGMQAVEAYRSAYFASKLVINSHADHAPDKSDANPPPASANPPQVILMDINMPILNGFEATRLIRAFEHQHGIQPAHIIALTGLGSASAQQEAFSSGVDLFLTKPVRLKELTKLLDQVRKEGGDRQ